MRPLCPRLWLKRSILHNRQRHHKTDLVIHNLPNLDVKRHNGNKE